MSEILLYYKRPDPTTWVYMSSFLTIGLYFVFHRFWSVRNLDIALLILMAPGLLMVHEGRRRQLRELESEAIAAGLMEDVRPPGYDRQSGADWPPADYTLVTTQVVQGDLENPEDSENPEDTGDSGDVSAGDTEDSGAAPAENPSESPASSQSKPTGSSTGAVDSDDVVTRVQPNSETVSEPKRDPEAMPIDLDAVDAGKTDRNQYAVTSQEYYSARALQRAGFIYLFVIQSLILLRLLMDPLMVRRPLLDPNLTTGGLYFISISLFIFMMGNVVTSTPRIQVMQGPQLGPGYALMHRLPTITTRPVSDALAGAEPMVQPDLDPSQQRWTMIAKVLAILAHLAIVTGIVMIGNRHFGNLRAGVGAATLYLMLPYTAQMTGRVDHALPAALLLWAIFMYRKPMVSGILLGLAAGLVYYPLFLLPLWCSFYWRRGVRRFSVGVVATLTVLMLLLSIGGTESFVDHLRLMFGVRRPIMDPSGVWGLGWSPIWRLPVIVGFVILCVFFAFWPSPKNLGTLISCSAAVMTAAQFWHGYGGGLYIAWFLPLLLLTIFRPNLQDRVALKVVEASKGASRRQQLEAKPA
ncbi:MAG: hypothetical protein HKN47_22615 [Pirellulaceae bacterium]|nr:hypothetical protein [Pirellulaceae bacterium]